MECSLSPCFAAGASEGRGGVGRGASLFLFEDEGCDSNACSLAECVERV